jgi:hypothetical protein
MTDCLPSVVQRRQDLLRMLPEAYGGVVAELGVFAGDFAEDIMTICRPRELHLIDRWQGLIECGNQHGEQIQVRDGESLFLEVLERFKNDDEVQVHRASTTFLTQHFGPGYFDVVYIDADHSQEAVWADLLMAAEAVGPQGVIAGHDYSPRFPGVMAAVDAFCTRYKWRIAMLTEDGCPSFVLRAR